MKTYILYDNILLNSSQNEKCFRHCPAIWNNLPTWCNWVFTCVLSAPHVSGLYAHLQEQWMLQFLYICSSATRHQHTHSSGPTPNYTKDTICCICKGNCNIHCSWRWAYKPETCRAERTQVNTQLHQVGKLIHNHSVNLTLMFPCIFSTIIIDNQQDATILIYLFLVISTCFGRCFRPSSGAYHCNYSFWYCCCWLVLRTQHQSAATSVDNIRSCSYSDVLLMMGENIARNM